MVNIADKEFADRLHLLIHSLRLIKDYKPSESEKQISALVIAKYEDTCSECKERGLALKYTPVNTTKSILDKILGK